MKKEIEVGDIVKYLEDIYVVDEILDGQVIMSGYSYRNVATAKISDLEFAEDETIHQENIKNDKFLNKITSNNYRTKNNKNILFGRVLHIDGDKRYLNSCIKLYEKIGINVTGLYIHEKNIYNKIEKIVEELHPDIVVITGHDNYNQKDIKDLDNYENSKYFLEAVKKIRSHHTFFELVIIAGACSSHFESLIANGANFASSPKRINTHTYDPAVIAIKVATTSCNKIVDFNNIIKYIENGRDAIGGVETYGKMKMLL